MENLNCRSIRELAGLVDKDWKKVNYDAKPYLEAMYSLNTPNDVYGCDDGKSIILYFLSNASSWRGPIAREIKAELKQRVK